jgi:hypothetical protein
VAASPGYIHFPVFAHARRRHEKEVGLMEFQLDLFAVRADQ